MRYLRYGLGFYGLLLGSFSVQSATMINGTRVIYPAQQPEITVKINNVGNYAVLLQSWIDAGDPKAPPETIKVPFVLSPPVNRVEAGKSQSLRLAYTQARLPTDRESVFWLNVLEIPPKPKGENSGKNYLQMAFRSRIKLFFRPDELPGDPNQSGSALIWSATGHNLKVQNPTPYYISLLKITIEQNGKTYQQAADMLPPFSNHEFSFTIPEQIAVGSKVHTAFINDYGAVIPVQQTIKD